ncbi:HATPase_EvgS-ArcB-TorS-like domain containing protein [Rhabdaerophilaceae bacterium]
MLAGWVAVSAALIYLLILFAVAYFGDTKGRVLLEGKLRPTIYALALAVYCTSWTFLGSVGLASRNGLDFLPIYLGPLIVFVIGLPLIARIIHIARVHRITSVADFIGSRYGKSVKVAALVAIIAIVGTIPYIALQLKAISAALETVVVHELGYLPQIAGLRVLGDISLFVTLVLAAFAVAFGTRHVDATEHQNGLMLAIATESFVKLIAFLAVGSFVVYVMFDGLGDLFTKAAQEPQAVRVLQGEIDPLVWMTTTVLAGFAILLLPRQFHVMVVENRDMRDLRQAAWQFPAYLIAINIFVVPIALAGLILLPGEGVDRDLMVIRLPLLANAGWVALLAFIGALSAATAMVIVESVACGIMISNDLVVPLLLRRPRLGMLRKLDDPAAPTELRPSQTMVDTVLTIRRVGVVLMLLLGFAYFRASEQAALATIGLLSFAAIAQLMPAFLLGLFWTRANAKGAFAGLLAGFLIWFYILFLPTLSGIDGLFASLVRNGPLGISALAPSNLLFAGWPPLVQGVVLSLGVNLFLLVTVSLMTDVSAIDRVQASLFTSPDTAFPGTGFKIWGSSVTVEELRVTVTRYLGAERTERAFRAYDEQNGLIRPLNQEADAQTIRFSEQILASAIGAASSRLVLSLMLRRRNVSTEAALKLLDDASAAIQHSRMQLQHGLDHAKQGVTVFDNDLRLMCWNKAFQDLFGLPDDLVRFGVGLDEIISHNARHGLYGEQAGPDVIANRITALVQETEPRRLHLAPRGMVIEIRSNHLPDGGLVTTYTDITEAVAAETALEEANITLENRVRERTEELLLMNKEFARAMQEADEANISKTRFLAAASHDIAQPLNAARIYASVLSEAARETEHADLARNVETSLNAVEEILSALLEMSRLDSAKLKPELSTFPLQEILGQLRIEFEPVARAKGIKLVVLPCSMSVTSDRRLLRRLLQNLISNAVKYTIKGKVLVGCRRRGNRVHVVVGDTGIGIPTNKQKTIFKEFQRLEQGAKIERGLGLGLSIVERIVKVLEHKLDLVSRQGKGSMFTLMLPLGDAAKARAGISNSQAPLPIIGSLNGRSVLIIDNEPSILDGMRKLLESWGCVVTTAADAQDSIKLFKASKTKPDIMLVDYHLDQANGIDAIVKMRWQFRSVIPAVLITADRTPEVRDRAANEVIDMLNKPIKPPALRALLVQIGLRRAAAAE